MRKEALTPAPGRTGRPWGGLATVVVVLAAAVWLSLGDDWLAILILGIWLTTTAAVGALVMANRPENAVGPLMLGGALWVSFGLMAAAYALYALPHEGVPLARFAAWLKLWVAIPGYGLFLHLLLRFPTGRIPSPRWKWLSRVLTVTIVASSLGYALREGAIDGLPGSPNPLGGVVPVDLPRLLISVGDPMLTSAGLLTIVSLFVRFYFAHRTERQQMKWFVVAVVAFPFLYLLGELAGAADATEEQYATFFLIALGLLLIPVSMGVGILRYRLYDIDLVVNRALVYGSLSAILVGVYLSVVVVLQQALRPLTPESDVAVAGSTLAVAALFRPLRTRLQAFIDRRFYRHKYDAAETLSRFSNRLREEVDLESLTHDLVTVVGSTMQPTHASVWLRPGVTP